MGDTSDKVNILLVDDEPKNLLALEASLETLGAHLVKASSGSEALRHLLNMEFAVVLLDVQMPDMDGFETASLIRARDRSRHLPIIFVTAISKASEHVLKGYSLGAVDYIFKPIEPEVLRSKVSVFVELFRNRESVKRQAEQLRTLEERKQAAEVLDAVRRQHEHILNAVGEGILGFDAQGRIAFANPAVTRITGWKKEELLGRLGHALLHHTRLDGSPCSSEECNVYAAIRHGAGYQSSETEIFWRKDGSHFAVDYMSTPVKEQGNVVGVLVFKDITDRKRIDAERTRLMRELEEAVRARDDFLSIASHELKTPLTPIQLGVQNLQRRIRQDPKLLAQWSPPLQTLNRQVERLDRLVDELLDVARISVGQLRLELEDVNVSEVLHDVVGRFNDELRNKEYQITIRADATISAHCDRLRLEQIITNLFSNAIKYGGGKGAIEISASCEKELVSLSIRDHGIGISAKDQARIFERFERLVSVRHYGGFGLGLWIVRQIVEAHGGAIRVTSTPGQGSLFVVEVPVAKARAASMDLVTSPSVSLNSPAPSMVAAPGAASSK